MALSNTEIRSLLAEVAPALTGGWVQKIHQPGPRTVTLEVRARGRTLTLLLSADPDTGRLHLAQRRYANPPTPPPFCQFLRARIPGARIEGIEQVGDDRLVRLRLTAREGPCSLVAELTGRSADLLLLDGQDRVLATLVEGRHEVGKPWAPPADRPRPEPEPAASPIATGEEPFPLSRLFEDRYHERETERARERARQARLAEIKKALRKTARRAEALRADLDKAGRYRDYNRYGELLKANLGGLEAGRDRATVVDYFDPALPELVIPLDPAKGPTGNMEEYFKKHRKFIAAERAIRPRLEAAERELDRLRAQREAVLDGAWNPPEPATAARHSAPRGSRPATTGKGTAKRSGPFRRFTSSDGLPIYVGRNARENEELTLRFAHSDDLWLHARGVPGSHVVVRLEKGTDPPQETLRDAATLALLYSDLKKSGKGEVIYTRRKWVRKAKGHQPGTVTVTQEKSLFVQMDRARLDRLKET